MSYKPVLSFFVGAAVGSLATIFFARKHYMSKAYQEVAEMREYVRQKQAAEGAQKRYSNTDEAKAEAADTDVVEDEDVRPATEEELEMLRQFNLKRVGVQRTDYTSMYKGDPTDPETVQMERVRDISRASLAEIEHPRDSHEDEDIQIISEREWFETHSTDYGKIELAYYEMDQTLCDDDEEIIPNPDSLLGYSWLNSFGQDSDDDDVVYIRNNRIATDYCITRIHGAFSQLVLGYIPDEDLAETRRRMADG